MQVQALAVVETLAVGQTVPEAVAGDNAVRIVLNAAGVDAKRGAAAAGRRQLRRLAEGVRRVGDAERVRVGQVRELTQAVVGRIDQIGPAVDLRLLGFRQVAFVVNVGPSRGRVGDAGRLPAVSIPSGKLTSCLTPLILFDSVRGSLSIAHAKFHLSPQVHIVGRLRDRTRLSRPSRPGQQIKPVQALEDCEISMSTRNSQGRTALRYESLCRLEKMLHKASWSILYSRNE